MSIVTYGIRVALTATLLLGTAACGGDDPAPARSPAGPTELAVPTPIPIDQGCTGEVPSGVEQRSLLAADGSVINTGWLGSGDTTAVLLHQTDGYGLCGFLFFADYLAARGVRVVAMDLCGYGQSFCVGRPLENDPAGQVKVVSDAVRADGAARVVLVGASMGGSVSLTAAKVVDADVIVDLSGPAEFGTSSVTADAGNVTMPALFAFSNTDRSDLEAVRKALPSMPSKRKEFLTYEVGHGYELLRDPVSLELTPLAERVLGWVQHG
jgi:dienelactone hydrolase